MTRIGNFKTAKHSYEATVEKNGQRFKITIDANTRASAGKLARDNGYSVCDMNMVG
uniref:Uncharacterized protein n=1 Tax=Pseudomonas phage HRDY3 TaxID=3236930 RepID=A0AB39CEP7_9VIRU